MVVINSDVTVYATKNLCFVLNKNDIIIKTPLQTFYLLPNAYWTQHFASNRMCLIREMIRLGEIRDLNELAGYTRPGITWTGTEILYDISNCHIKQINNRKRRINFKYEYDV